MLVGTGVLNLRGAVLIIVGIEALLFLAGARQLFVVTHRYRQDRASGLDAWSALEEALTVVLPRPVAKIVALEVHLWACLTR